MPAVCYTKRSDAYYACRQQSKGAYKHRVVKTRRWRWTSDDMTEGYWETVYSLQLITTPQRP